MHGKDHLFPPLVVKLTLKQLIPGGEGPEAAAS